MTPSLYLYGILPAPAPTDLALEGLDRQPVQTQQIDEFVFLYSSAQQTRYLASRRNLLGHEQVLEQAIAAGHRALLPLQFGLTIQDWHTVKSQLLAPHGSQLQHLFAKLTHHREVGVKVFWQTDAELQALLTEQADLRTQRDRLAGRRLSMDEVVAIGQAIEQAMAARQQHIVAAFQTTLQPLASEMVENDPLTAAMIYNAAYLIPWDAEPHFAAAIETLDHRFLDRLKIRYNAFTAPFNFAQLNLTAA